MPRTLATAAAPLLALLLVLANVLPEAGFPRPRAVHAPVRSSFEPLALVVPGLYEELPTAPVLGAAPPPPGGSLARAAWVPHAAGPERLPYIGLAPLLLALVALAGAAGRGAWAARALLLLSVLVGSWPGPMGPSGVRLAGLLCVAGLAGLAALGLSGCSRPLPTAESAPPPASGFALAALAVLLAAALSLLAVRVGAASDRAALDGLVAHAAAQDWSPAVLAVNAAWLGALLDRAALAAFASMTVLLLHLKARRAWSLALVVIVSLADTFSAGRI
jgi:hypothetical protein